MVELPTWLDFASRENAAASSLRSLSAPSFGWGTLIASAQAVVARYQGVAASETSRLLREENALALIAAARILDTASQSQIQLPAEHRQNLAIYAASAFAMYGNFPSADATLSRAFGTTLPGGADLQTAVATIAPNMLGRILSSPDLAASKHRDYLELLARFLVTGDPDLHESLRSGLVQCLLECADTFATAAYASAIIALEQVFALSACSALRTHLPVIPQGYFQRLADSGIKVLMPPQLDALRDTQTVTGSQNAIVALPTGTGKTLLAELAIVNALAGRTGAACYVAPYVALGNQVARSLAAHLPDDFSVRRMFGGYQEPDPLDPEDERVVIVATPERFDALLRTQPDLVGLLRIVVFDEAHIVENAPRGARIEGLITRLRLLQGRNDFRLVLLSAVLSDFGDLSSWLGVSQSAIAVSSWRPTARRLAIWRDDGELVWYLAEDPIKPSGATRSSVLTSLTLPWPEPSYYQPRHFGQIRIQEGGMHRNVAYLADLLWRRYEEPLLCVCSTKAHTRTVAAAIADRFEDLTPLPGLLATAIGRIETSYRYLLPMTGLLRRGVAFHNSSVPQDVRQLIEDAVKSRVVRAVAATTTLAEGIDLPFRFTIVTDWLHYQGDEEPEPMSTLLFRNIAGRCGRAREFTEGDTIIFDNPLGQEEFTARPTRHSFQMQMFVEQDPSIVSALSVLADDRRGEQVNQVTAALASEFLASVPENSDVDDLAQRFFDNTLVAQHSQVDRSPIKRKLDDLVQNMLDDSEAPLATAASPLQLTGFGRAANATGFSPASCRSMLAFLREDIADASISNVAASLLRELGRLPEQGFSPLAKRLVNNRIRFCVRPEDLPVVIGQWLTGVTLEDMFVALPTNRRSTRVPKVGEWYEGERGFSDWDGVFDKFVDFTSSVLQQYLPWVMRSCDSIKEVAGGWSLSLDWRLWARLLENGVDSLWALAALDASTAPATRRAAVALGHFWPPDPDFVSYEDPLGIRSLADDAVLARFGVASEQAARELGGSDTDSGKELLDLIGWMTRRAGFLPQ